MPSVRDAVQRTDDRPVRSEGPNERLVGYAVMGLPFASGHYLSFRRWPSNPFGRPYSAVWHRDPDGGWTFFVDAPADRSCPRYFDSGIRSSIRTDIAVSWSGPAHLTVTVPDVLAWDLDFASTPATAMLSAAARTMPARLWERKVLLAAMGRTAGGMLRAGRMRLAGTTTNGQWFRAAPERLWSVAGSTAVLGGEDLGPLGPLAEQARLGDFRLPQRGLLMMGAATFEAFDPARHRTPRPALTPAHR